MKSARTPWFHVALVVGMVGLAGCFSGGDESEPETEPDPPRPGTQAGIEDATLSSMGRWLTPFEGDVAAINMVLLHDGRVLYWSGVEARDEDGLTEQVFLFGTEPYWAESRIVDFSTDPPTITAPGNHTEEDAIIDLFCAGATILPDGRVMTVGGSDWMHFPEDGDFFLQGIEQAVVFDPATDNWTLVADMNLGRWYPTIFTDASGNAVVASGIESLTDPQDQWASWERYDEQTDTWSEVAGMDALLPLYPHLYTVAGGPLKGNVFFNTVGTLWGPFGEHPQEYEWMQQKSFDMDAGTWRDLGPSVFGIRNYGVSVMLPLAQERDYAPEFVHFGGSLSRSLVASPFTERNDLATDPPTNTMAALMNHPRWNHQGIGLPDGTILAIGGGLYDNVYLHGQQNVPVLPAEIYDAASDTWTEVAEMTVPRMYHSTAVLLPDARVLVGGHVPLPELDENTLNPQIVETRQEIYEPGYLFRGDRPVVVDAPRHVTYRDTFDVDLELPAELDSIVLVHPGAVTHAWDSNQRTIELEVVAQNGTVVTVAAPPDGHVAPPGYYMLFALSSHPDGPVPSEAAWLHII